MDFFAEDRGLKPIFSKVVGCKFAEDSSVEVNSCCGMNFRSSAVFTPNTKSINLGITSINTTDKIGSVSVPTTRVGMKMGSSDWIRHGHGIEEATVDRESKTRANIDYILKSDFETMREIQYFEPENISMTNGTTSPIDDSKMMIKYAHNTYDERTQKIPFGRYHCFTSGIEGEQLSA